MIRRYQMWVTKTICDFRGYPYPVELVQFLMEKNEFRSNASDPS